MCAMYGKVEYWNARYQKLDKSKPSEWYRSYQQFSYLLSPTVLIAGTDDSGSKTNGLSTKDCTFDGNTPSTLASRYSSFPDRCKARVLIVGCGNSSLPFDMVSDGWTGGIVGVDFSPLVIQQMRDKVLSSILNLATDGHDLSELLQFVCADVTKPIPGYAPGSFDLIVCKGTLDAILCSQGSHAKAKSFIRNCVDLLSTQSGVLALITTGNPDSRFEYLEYQNALSSFWHHVSVYPIRGECTTNNIKAGKQPPVVFCYICRKRCHPDCYDVGQIVVPSVGTDM